MATVGSTNDEARRLAAAGAPDGTVVLAHRQTSGRGRRGRNWYSAGGLGLYLSVLFRIQDRSRPLTRWTLAAAVAACEACRDLTGATVRIKWPNDLVHEGRKLGGILAEARSTGGGRDAELVIGAGINVRHRAEDLPPALVGSATSLHLLTCGSMLERESLAAAYLRRLARVVAELRRERWDLVARDFERLAPTCRGVQVRAVGVGPGAAGEIVGVTDGLDSSGALLVRDAAGHANIVRMADAVRPIED